MGAFASRVTVMTGEATRLAASKVRAKAIDMAAELLQAPPDELDVDRRRGRAARRRRGPRSRWPRSRVPCCRPRAAAASAQPGLAAEGWFHTDHMNYPYGVHVAVVRVDRETGGGHVERYLVAYDVGRAVNPMLVEGQIAGGFAQGLGGALFEEFLYDERGEPLAVTFADYLMPTAREVPPLDVSSRRMRRARSIRSASRARAKAASMRSAPRSPRRSTTRSACRAR